MLTEQKVFSALEVSKRNFLTTFNQKIGKKECFCLKQALLAKSFELSRSPFSRECAVTALVAGPAKELSSGGSRAWDTGAGHLAPPQPQQHVAVSGNAICWHSIPMARHIWKKNCSIIIASILHLPFSPLCKKPPWEYYYSLKFKYVPPIHIFWALQSIHTLQP